MLLVDGGGEPVQANLYGAFGEVLRTWGDSRNDRLGNTKEYDRATGLANHGFRYYDPATGRYLSEDPLGYEGGFNLHVHCGNDPVNKFDPLGLSDDEPEYKKRNHLDIEKSSDSVYFVEKSGRRTLLGRFFRGMSEYNSADAYFDDWSHRPALVRDMDSRAGGLDADAIRKKCLDEATGKVDEDKYRQEIINGLKGNWREQRQNFEEYQNSLGNRLTVEQLRSEVWRQRQEEDADAYTPIYGRVIFGEDRFGTGLSNASNRNRIVESQVKQIEIALKIAEYALDIGTMVPWGGLGRAGEAAAGGLSIPLKMASEKELQNRLVAGTVGKSWNPLTGPGPLGEKTAKTFRSATYTETILTEPTVLYRSYGGKAEAVGGFWTRTKPAGPLQSRIDSALDPSWGNTVSSVSAIRVPAGTKIYEGAAAAQREWMLGGGNQVFIPEVDKSWMTKP